MMLAWAPAAKHVVVPGAQLTPYKTAPEYWVVQVTPSEVPRAAPPSPTAVHVVEVRQLTEYRRPLNPDGDSFFQVAPPSVLAKMAPASAAKQTVVLGQLKA
jgi:hypothetical protein